MINKLLFFGCSFTAVETSQTNVEFENYRYKLSKNINLNHISYAQPGKSNEHIIDDVYTLSNDILNVDTVFIIQYSFFNRLGLRADSCNNEFISLCKRNIDNTCRYPENRHIIFYKDWLKYFYSEKSSVLEFEKNVNLISNWLNYKKIKFISIGFDLAMNSFSDDFYANNNFIKFDNTYSMYDKSIDAKLRIFDLGTGPDYNDYHLNEEGNDYLSDKITNKLKELQYI